MPTRKPISLLALRAFEAAARHMSFKDAAQELNVSQAAVSRHIRFLEATLERPLFRRLHRRVELTAEGRCRVASRNFVTGCLISDVTSLLSVLSGSGFEG